ncbi:MAG: uroporphyrinogen-III synthase [Porticoccaceae bacterium]|nr:uroporphyrinogen-III synthase [Porticoccaceae bacterium]
MSQRILVIRPSRQVDQFIALLEQAGAQICHTPVMTIEPLVDGQEIKNLILEVDNFDKAICVSGNAAQLTLEWLDRYWPMMPVGIEFFAVGQQTAEILASADITALSPMGRQNSEALLALPELQVLSDQRVIIFRGCGGREILGDTLMERGARVDYCELYRRVINPEQAMLARQQLAQSDCLVAHSGELLQALGEQVGEPGAGTPVVVPSERVAEIARELGYQNIISAENALPESMFAAVEKAL